MEALMESRGRTLALLGLVVLAAIHGWVLFAMWEFMGLVGAKLHLISWPLVLPFVILPWALTPAPLVGVWLLFQARHRGGGRWRWRWWIGGSLSSLLVWQATGLPRWFGSGESLVGGHPFVELLLNLAAIPLLWVLASRRAGIRARIR